MLYSSITVTNVLPRGEIPSMSWPVARTNIKILLISFFFFPPFQKNFTCMKIWSLNYKNVSMKTNRA